MKTKKPPTIPDEPNASLLNEIPNMLGLSKEEKDDVVKKFMEITGKHCITLFYMLGLEAKFEGMVCNVTDGKEFILSFKTVDQFVKDGAVDENKPGVSVKETERLMALVNIQDEYIKFLGSEVDKHASYLYVHGIKCPQEIYEKGVRLRGEIAKLKEGLEISKDKPTKNQ